MSPAYVFVVIATGVSEHTITTEVRGVFAHMHQTTSLVRQIQTVEHMKALVTKHEVINSSGNSSVDMPTLERDRILAQRQADRQASLEEGKQ